MARQKTPQYRGTLAKPLYLASIQADELETTLLRALCTEFGISPDEHDAKDRVLWALAFSHVPALQIPPEVYGGRGSFAAVQKILHMKNQNRAKVDSSDVYCAVSERRIAHPGTIADTCQHLSRIKKLEGEENPFYRVPWRLLVASYHRFQSSLLGRFSLTAPARLCAHRKTGPCLTRDQLDELDIATAHTACKMGEECRFWKAARAAAEKVDQEIQKGRTRLANLKRLIELRRWAWPANPLARKGK